MNRQRTRLFARAVSAAATVCIATIAGMPALAQQSATVSVNAGTALGTIPTSAFGVNTAVWDGNLLDASVPTLLQQAGTNLLRFPGGSTADDYHWQTNSITTGQGGYANPSNTFDAFMAVAGKAGSSAIVTVNYGSNAAGTAGGDPTEAAGWVTYSNKTKGYGVKYWEIGNEIYGNGEYGSAWETDLHSAHDPTTYGTNCLTFISDMKAADSTIKCGVVLTAPGNWPDGVSPAWNPAVLTACGSKIDFVIVHWYSQGPGSESDSGLLGDPSQIASMVSTLRSEINQYCGSNASNVQIFVTETNSVSYNPGKQSVSLVNGIFLADDYMTWLENGVGNVDWWDLHNGPATGNNNSSSLYGSATYGDYGLLANGTSPEPAAETPFPPYYGYQMLTKLGKAGDTMVSSSSSASLVTAHAVKQANGNLALLLLDKDPSNSYKVNVSIAGYTPASSGTTYTYGESSSAITSASTSGLGATFSATISPYSLNTIVMTPGTASPSFTISGSASPSSVAVGSATTVTANPKDTGGALSNANVQIMIVNSSGTAVDTQNFTENFAAGQTIPCTVNWTPTTAGTYTIEGGVFNQSWGTNYVWNGNMGTITATAGDSSEYNFESSAQGWTTSGSPIASVATSTAQHYAGAQSLAVNINGAAGSAQAYVASPSTAAGKTVTFHVWVPSGSKVSAVQPFVMDKNWTWTGNYQAIGSLTAGAWNTITVTVPTNAVLPLQQLGVQFTTNATWTGTCYVDSVSW